MGGNGELIEKLCKEKAQLRSDLAACRERCEALEWLVEVERLFTVEYHYDAVCLNNAAEDEFYATYKAALAAVEGE